MVLHCECSELVKLCHINRSGPVLRRERNYLACDRQKTGPVAVTDKGET